jgi:aerotaxis receptor
MTRSRGALQDGQLARQKAACLDEEVPFSFEEIFFSRTDEKGIILSGNSVFQRVSAYEWDELLHRPHSLIRHPDMPKAVFWLMWDTIKKGEPIGAYVKNRAKDGRYYWVFAIVTPIESGFLSVRIKPSSALFDIVKQEYASLRRLERENSLKAEESARLLLSRLQDLNFEDYGAFMSAALSQEISTRNVRVNRAGDDIISDFNSMLHMSRDLFDRIKSTLKEYRESKYIPINLRAQAARLGKSGEPIGVISNNYASISADAKDSMDLIMDFGQQMAKTIDEGLFLAGIARVQQEVCESFERETPNHGVSRDQEMRRLEQQQAVYSIRAVDGLREISARFAEFQEACSGMRKLTLGLEITCMMGKIESARLKKIDDSLNSLIGGLGKYQEKILDDLKEINRINHNIQLTINGLFGKNISKFNFEISE